MARPAGAPWGDVLVLFAGPGGERDLPARLRARGLAVTAIDTKRGGAGHNVLRPRTGDELLRRVRRGDFDAVFLATPCSSYSVAHRPQLRSRKQPDGLRNAPEEWRAYLAKHNALARWSADAIRAAEAAGAPRRLPAARRVCPRTLYPKPLNGDAAPPPPTSGFAAPRCLWCLGLLGRVCLLPGQVACSAGGAP